MNQALPPTLATGFPTAPSLSLYELLFQNYTPFGAELLVTEGHREMKSTSMFNVAELWQTALISKSVQSTVSHRKRITLLKWLVGVVVLAATAKNNLVVWQVLMSRPAYHPYAF